MADEQPAADNDIWVEPSKGFVRFLEATLKLMNARRRDNSLNWCNMTSRLIYEIQSNWRRKIDDSQRELFEAQGCEDTAERYRLTIKWRLEKGDLAAAQPRSHAARDKGDSPADAAASQPPSDGGGGGADIRAQPHAAKHGGGVGATEAMTLGTVSPLKGQGQPQCASQEQAESRVEAQKREDKCAVKQGESTAGTVSPGSGGALKGDGGGSEASGNATNNTKRAKVKAEESTPRIEDAPPQQHQTAHGAKAQPPSQGTEQKQERKQQQQQEQQQQQQQQQQQPYASASQPRTPPHQAPPPQYLYPGVPLSPLAILQPSATSTQSPVLMAMLHSLGFSEQHQRLIAALMATDVGTLRCLDLKQLGRIITAIGFAVPNTKEAAVQSIVTFVANVRDTLTFSPAILSPVNVSPGISHSGFSFAQPGVSMAQHPPAASQPSPHSMPVPPTTAGPVASAESAPSLAGSGSGAPQAQAQAQAQADAGHASEGKQDVSAVSSVAGGGKAPVKEEASADQPPQQRRHSLDAQVSSQRKVEETAIYRFSVIDNGKVNQRSTPAVGVAGYQQIMRAMATDGDVVRCRCGIQIEDGPMIKCDSCEAWQHCVCMDVPAEGSDDYACEVCSQRELPESIVLRNDESTSSGLVARRYYKVYSQPHFNLTVGTFVYFKPPEEADLRVGRVLEIFEDEAHTQPRVVLDTYVFPRAISHTAGRRIFNNEVFLRPTSGVVPVSSIISQCCVVDVQFYRLGDPVGFEPCDVFVCEFTHDADSDTFDPKPPDKWGPTSDMFELRPLDKPRSVRRRHTIGPGNRMPCPSSLSDLPTPHRYAPVSGHAYVWICGVNKCGLQFLTYSALEQHLKTHRKASLRDPQLIVRKTLTKQMLADAIHDMQRAETVPRRFVTAQGTLTLQQQQQQEEQQREALRQRQRRQRRRRQQRRRGEGANGTHGRGVRSPHADQEGDGDDFDGEDTVNTDSEDACETAGTEEEQEEDEAADARKSETAVREEQEDDDEEDIIEDEAKGSDRRKRLLRKTRSLHQRRGGGDGGKQGDKAPQPTANSPRLIRSRSDTGGRAGRRQRDVDDRAAAAGTSSSSRRRRSSSGRQKPNRSAQLSRRSSNHKASSRAGTVSGSKAARAATKNTGTSNHAEARGSTSSCNGEGIDIASGLYVGLASDPRSAAFTVAGLDLSKGVKMDLPSSVGATTVPSLRTAGRIPHKRVFAADLPPLGAATVEVEEVFPSVPTLTVRLCYRGRAFRGVLVADEGGGATRAPRLPLPAQDKPPNVVFNRRAITFSCPEEDCSAWFASAGEFVKHMNEQHSLVLCSLREPTSLSRHQLRRWLACPFKKCQHAFQFTGALVAHLLSAHSAFGLRSADAQVIVKRRRQKQQAGRTLTLPQRRRHQLHAAQHEQQQQQQQHHRRKEEGQLVLEQKQGEVVMAEQQTLQQPPPGGPSRWTKSSNKTSAQISAKSADLSIIRGKHSEHGRDMPDSDCHASPAHLQARLLSTTDQAIAEEGASTLQLEQSKVGTDAHAMARTTSLPRKPRVMEPVRVRLRREGVEVTAIPQWEVQRLVAEAATKAAAAAAAAQAAAEATNGDGTGQEASEDAVVCSQGSAGDGSLCSQSSSIVPSQETPGSQLSHAHSADDSQSHSEKKDGGRHNGLGTGAVNDEPPAKRRKSVSAQEARSGSNRTQVTHRRMIVGHDLCHAPLFQTSLAE